SRATGASIVATLSYPAPPVAIGAAGFCCSTGSDKCEGALERLRDSLVLAQGEPFVPRALEGRLVEVRANGGERGAIPVGDPGLLAAAGLLVELRCLRQQARGRLVSARGG